MESFLEHFVHMVLCKCAVVLIKAENMKPSLCDAVRQGKNAETIVSKGNALPNKEVFKKEKKKISWERLHETYFPLSPSVYCIPYCVNASKLPKKISKVDTVFLLNNQFLIIHR